MFGNFRQLRAPHLEARQPSDVNGE
jgi:hypothetical protein